uniref:Uncharacterized protein n=1 Tax=Zea mays TaxID=4577 RepID=A0A804NJF9_MAIZE
MHASGLTPRQARGEADLAHRPQISFQTRRQQPGKGRPCMCYCSGWLELEEVRRGGDQGLVLTVLSASRISWTGGTDACNFLLGNVIPLKFGYVGVVNHNQEAYHGLAHCWVVSQLAKELNMIVSEAVVVHTHWTGRMEHLPNNVYG